MYVVVKPGPSVVVQFEYGAELSYVVGTGSLVGSVGKTNVVEKLGSSVMVSTSDVTGAEEAIAR